MDAPILRLVSQRHTHDCGVAVLAMLFGVTYEEALIALSWEIPSVLRSGVYIRHLKQAAKNLGSELIARRRYDLEEDFGMLCVSSQKWKTDHLLILHEGRIYDTDGTVWAPDVYLRHHEARPGYLLVVKES